MPTFLSAGRTIQVDEHRPLTEGRHPAIVLLHGAGGNAGFWSERIAPRLAERNLALYVLHYFARTGTVAASYDQIVDGVHFPAWLACVADGIRWVRERPGVDAERIALVGVSLGAFLGLAYATEPESRLRAIVELSGGLAEPYAARATAQFPPTILFHGADDTWVTVSDAEKLDTLLSRLRVEHETHIFRGQGHFFDALTQMQILMHTAAFLRRRL